MMQMNKMNRNSPEEISNMAINDKLLEWEKLDNGSSPLSTFQRNTCLDLGDEVIPRLLPTSLIGDDYSTSGEQGEQDIVIESAHQFLEWYSAISNDWLNSGSEKYEPYLSELIEKRNKCTDILLKVEESIEQLNKLKLEYEQVSGKTNPLFTTSEKLSVEQEKLCKVLNNVNEKLHPFQTIESVYKRLESSAVAVTSPDFLRILDDIDKCHEYFSQHESYRECSSYQLKTRHCLSRALLDVKSYVTSVLDTCKMVPSAPVSLLPTSSVEGATITTAKTSKFIAQYGRFQTVAARLKPLLTQLENRTEKAAEYECALEECQKYYFNVRQQIIGPSLKDYIQQLGTTRMGDYCSLLRSSATYLIHLTQDEDKLYYQFFSKASVSLSDYIESICSILYDTMRPLVIHMKHMETLTEFCSILRVEILKDHVENNPGLQPFGNVAEQLLKDVQERLVFRAHMYFKTDILQFNPSPGDLAYPDKLEMMKNIAEEIKAQENTSLSRYDSRLSLASIGSCGDSVRSSRRTSTHSSPADLHGMWYPTIRRTLVCLSRLYRCVENAVFQGLAQEAISCCLQNVNEAAQTISKNKSVLDGHLFQIKHLLILREQIAPFQVDMTVTEMSLDFSNLKTAAYGLFQRNKLFALNSNNAILEFILHGSPLLKENYLDSRKIVDKQLKTTCEAFIAYAASLVTNPITNFMQKVHEHRTVHSTEPVKSTAFGKPEMVQEVVKESVKTVKSFIGMLQHKMELYLANPDTQFILYKPIKNNIISSFAKMQAVLGENYDTEEQLLIGCPTPEQISVLLSSTLLSRKISTSSMCSSRDVQENSKDRIPQVVGQSDS
ncbi:conserved oligomeric Golgi complex subunit 3 [Planococcus citri]|uniref:conserved oligomeric Golgi complex subunit 3 n=1 Tax=Planococcus citri TaxID=170843 RepID=UPI0031F8E9E6